MVPVRLDMYHQATNKLNKAQARSLWMSKQMQNTPLRQSYWGVKHQSEKTTGKIADYKLFVREAMIETQNIKATLAINYYKSPYNLRSKNVTRYLLRDFCPANSPYCCFSSGTLRSNWTHTQWGLYNVRTLPKTIYVFLPLTELKLDSRLSKSVYYFYKTLMEVAENFLWLANYMYVYIYMHLFTKAEGFIW